MNHPLPPRPGRIFSSDDILSGRVRLHTYPFRYICLNQSTGDRFRTVAALGSSIPNEMDKMFSAVELLESQGWELVAVEQMGLVVFMRRRLPG